MRLAALFALLLPVVAYGQSVPPAPMRGTATGVVFEDKNGNGKRDRNEPGIPGVRVSNQKDIAVTDRNGRWKLPHNDDTIFFVVKPRNWMTPVDENKVPRFYYIHKPAGSPKLKFEGVKPTGPLPASIDFPLTRKREPNKFSALFFGDTQPRDLREVDYIARDIVEPLIGKTDKYTFGVTLGDVVFDDLSVTEPLVRTIGLLGLPWYYVLGNHDMNLDAPDDRHSDEFWERTFGPNYYSFDHGPTHFVVLDNVVWHGKGNLPAPTYKAGLGKTQLEWLKNDLDRVPKNQLVVLMMHIPMTEIAEEEKQQLFRLLEVRPYALSVSAHAHLQEHRFITDKDGWRRPEAHHHVINVTTCGSWWGGAPDGTGVPHATMWDGAPNGYSIFSFDGNQYSIQFRAARRPASDQMNVIAPESLKMADVGGTRVYANVYGGSERSKVEMRFGDGPWVTMQRTIEEDPSFLALAERDKNVQRPYRGLPGAAKSTHLWRGSLPKTTKPGVFPLHVRSTDMFGQVSVTTRAIRVN